MDVLWQQEEILLQHLVATHGYLLGVSHCEQARTPRRPPSLAIAFAEYVLHKKARARYCTVHRAPVRGVRTVPC